MSDHDGSRAHKNLKNQIRIAMGAIPWVACFANESGVAYALSGKRCLECGNKRDARPIRFGVGAGGSDLICIVRRRDGAGVFVGLEIKTGNAKQQRNQKLFQSLIEGLGGWYFVVRSVEDAIRAVHEVEGS